jgi:hypothetical protein
VEVLILIKLRHSALELSAMAAVAVGVRLSGYIGG